MKNKSHLTAFLFILAIIIFAASCGGGGGGGGSVVSFGNNSGPHNGGDAGGWGNGGYNGNGFGGNGGSIGSGDEGEIIITGSTPLNVTKYVYNGTEYSDVKALTTALKASGNLPDSFNVDFYVDSEGTPRTARVTANGQANNGQDIFIEHQYKAAFPTGNGGSQDVFFYKRDGITLPGEGGTVTIDGFDFESGWKIDGTFYSPGAKLSVASSGDVDLRSRAVQETSVFGFKTDGAGGYIMGFNSNALQANSNNIVVSSDKQISSIELPSNPVNLDLSQATGFTNVNFGSSNKERLAGITLPNTATAIADGAFLNCSSLSSINLPPSVTTIGDNAFDTSALTAIEIPASVQSIGLGAFNSCDALGTVTFAAGSQLQEIGGNAFFDCSNLSTIELPSTVDTIGQYAFAGCTSLESFTIPNGVTELEGTFFGCSNLASISIPPSVNSLGQMTFKNVNSGCQLIINSNAGTMSVDNSAMPQSSYKVKFTGTSIPTTPGTPGSTIFNSYLSEVTLANTVTAIPQNAFQGCSALTKVTIENTSTEPSVLSSIGGSAFYNCTNLQTINIPGTVNAIGSQAFFQAGDGNLEITFEDSQTMTQCSLPNQNYKVVLNRGVPKIGGGVLGDNGPSIFENDMNLKEVVYAGGPNLMAYAFTGCSSLTTVTFQSYPTAIQTTPLPDNVHNIIFAPKSEMFIHDVSMLFSSGSVSVTFQFKNSADVGSVPPMITIRSDAFLSFGTSTSYQFDSEPDYYIYYESSSCFPAGSTGTRDGTNYTWTLSGSTYYWQQ